MYKYKRYGTLFLVVVFVLGVLVTVSTALKPVNEIPKDVLPAQTQNQEVTVVVNFGDSEKIISVTAGNAYTALVEASKKLGIEVKTKHYDFGDMVETIGDKTNSKEKVWIYYVNNVSGDVAADKKEVKAGDKVEWKYEKPVF